MTSLCVLPKATSQHSDLTHCTLSLPFLLTCPKGPSRHWSTAHLTKVDKSGPGPVPAPLPPGDWSPFMPQDD